jgi:hypothetical protein
LLEGLLDLRPEVDGLECGDRIEGTVIERHLPDISLDDLLHVDWSSILDYDMDCEKEVSDFLVGEVGFSAARLQTLKDSITA